MAGYLNRLSEKKIREAMDAIGAVVIEGPKWCGKSTTGARFAKTIVKLQDPITFKNYKAYANTSRSVLLRGEKPLMFDEWQKIPDLWDFIRLDVDETSEAGQYILTGSAKPIEDKNRHSGTGRFAKVVMRPMSLWESEESSGEVSLGKLFDGEHQIYGKSKTTFEKYAYLVCRGGWPESLFKTDKQALMLAREYYNSLVTTDIVDVDGIKRNPARAKAVLRSYARNISSLATYKTIHDDLLRNEDTFDDMTLTSYINAFEKLFVVENVTAWLPRLRSKTAMRVSDKKQFVDPSIAAIALDANPNDLISDLNTFGLLFESLCVRDLRVYSQSLNGEVHHFRDLKGFEVDAIVHLDSGKWGAIEIKLGGNQIDEAAANLLKLKEKVDTERMSEPSFLMVLTGTPNAYLRPDGVLVVPIGCLKN
ncbi:MAG: DUF4143 domain-containing protein [Clostridiales bacterium]|jgi:predicted AAA+ superfamily ATPase|nr:DUF4143 domain-containing protein [Clostridiales bacterium]